MPSENIINPNEMKPNCVTAASGGDGGRDVFMSWLRAEFVFANSIIDSLCHHLHSMGEPGEYDLVIGCVQQRRVSWNHVLHLQPFFPCTEIMHALQEVERRRQQRVVDQCKVGETEFGRSVVLDFGSRQVQRPQNNRGSNGVDCQNLYVNASIVGNAEVAELGHEVRKSMDKHLPGMLNAIVDGSLKTSRTSDGADNPQIESQLKDVKVEISSKFEGNYSHVTNTGLSIQLQNEGSLTISPETFHPVETNAGTTVNVGHVAEGLNVYEDHLSQADNSRLISHVNDLRVIGEHIQIPGDYEANQTKSSPNPVPDSRFRWSHDEDLHLIDAWLNTDKGVVANQKPKPFWERIVDYYGKGKLDSWVGRGSKHCKNRWQKITSSVYKFVSFYEEVCKENTSEQAEDEVIRQANKLYHNSIGMNFMLEHAWRVLQSETKWRDTHMKLNLKANTIEDSMHCSKRMKIIETGDAYLNVSGNAVVDANMDSAKAMKMKVNDNAGCSLSSSSTASLRSLEENGKRSERECSDDPEGNMRHVTEKDEEYKMMNERDNMKLKMQQEYLLAKKYDLLSNLVSQSGSLTSKEMLFKEKLVEDLLKR